MDPADGGRQASFGPCRIEAGAIARAVIAALADLGNAQPTAICIGSTGVPGRLARTHLLAQQLFAETSAEIVVVAGDSLTTHVGALGYRPGTVIAAGTGAMALGTDHRDRWQRADGWGHLLGDLGSGAWIGARGIAAALSALDGKAGSDLLLKLLLERYGTTTGLVEAVYHGQWPASEIARFAPVVAEAALMGDLVARHIWHEAAFELARSVVAASDGLPPRFSWGGGLFRVGSMLATPFAREVLRRVPGAEVSAPQAGSVEGALAIARGYVRGTTLPETDYQQCFERDALGAS